MERIAVETLHQNYIEEVPLYRKLLAALSTVRAHEKFDCEMKSRKLRGNGSDRGLAKVRNSFNQ